MPWDKVEAFHLDEYCDLEECWDILDRAALERIAPYLAPEIRAAELCRNEGKLNPLVANRKMTATLEGLGVARLTDRIARIEDTTSGIEATGSRTYRADLAIVAAAWGLVVGGIHAGAKVHTRIGVKVNFWHFVAGIVVLIVVLLGFVGGSFFVLVLVPTEPRQDLGRHSIWRVQTERRIAQLDHERRTTDVGGYDW